MVFSGSVAEFGKDLEMGTEKIKQQEKQSNRKSKEKCHKKQYDYSILHGSAVNVYSKMLIYTVTVM